MICAVFQANFSFIPNSNQPGRQFPHLHHGQEIKTKERNGVKRKEGRTFREKEAKGAQVERRKRHGKGRWHGIWQEGQQPRHYWSNSSPRNKKLFATDRYKQQKTARTATNCHRPPQKPSGLTAVYTAIVIAEITFDVCTKTLNEYVNEWWVCQLVPPIVHGSLVSTLHTA